MVIRTLGTCLALVLLCASAGAGENPPKKYPPQEPFFQLREHPTEYAGPGREDPAPTDVKEVRIGYFGPSDPSHPDGGDMWLAAQMAVEEANLEGGYRGKPFRLLPVWSENPWGTGVGQVARIVYTDKVWTIVGGIDGPSTHLAEQVVAKARLTLISPASTDKTVNLANVPWMFSCLPGDHLQAPVVAAAMWHRVGNKPFVMVSANDHDSREFTRELMKCFKVHGIFPRYHLKCRPAAPEIGELVTRIVRSQPSAVVLAAGAHDSARLVAALRREGFKDPVFGGSWMARRRFQEEAGSAAEGVLFPLLYNPDDAPAEFTKTFRTRFGRSPDYAAAGTYDAVRLLVAAIRKAGLNRARIRDAVQELSPWPGVTGTVQWDSLGSNPRPVRLGTIRDGQIVTVAEKS